MTFERRIVVKPSEIRVVTLECKACRFRFSFPPSEGRKRLVMQCLNPNCTSEWVTGTKHEFSEEPYAQLLAVLRVLAAEDTESRFNVFLEFDEPMP